MEINIGSKVRIQKLFINHEVFWGYTGYVVGITVSGGYFSGTVYQVRIENHILATSTISFDERELILIRDNICEVKKKGEYNMRPTGFKEAAKINISGKPYYYALYGSAGVKAGDKVLVTGTASNRIHTVEDVVSAETALLEVEKPLCEEVICKVDTSAYDARVKQREQKAKLRKLMEATVAQMDEVDKFRVYADHNPEMAKLLAQYNEINV